MQSSYKLILKNLFSLVSAEIFSKILGVISTAYLARTILPDGFGILGFGIAFLSYFNNLVIFGTDTISVRDLSKDKSKLSLYFSNVTIFRLFIAAATITLVLILINLIEFESTTKNVILILSLTLLQPVFSSVYIYQAIERMEFIAMINSLKSILLLIGYLLFVKSTEDIFIAALVFAAVTVIDFIVVFTHIHLKISPFQLKPNYRFIQVLLKDSYPLAISSIMIAIYYNLDMVMLGFMKTDYEVGIYHSAFKLYLIGVLPFGIIAKVFLPSLSKIINESFNDFKKLFSTYFFSLITIGLVIGIIYYFIADIIISIIYGDLFQSSSMTLKILSMTIIIVGVNVSFGNPLTVWNRHKVYTIAVTIGAIGNIILNFILIPKYSHQGAAFATMLSETLVFIGVLYYFRNSIRKISPSEI